MKIIRKLSSLILILFLCLIYACGKPFEQTHNFPGASWHRFNILAFQLPIKNPSAEYTVNAIMRYTDDLVNKRIPLHFIMKMPSGEERIWEQTIEIRDKDGIHMGTKKDGVYELTVPVRLRLQSSEEGICHITVEQFIPKYNTKGIVSFGLQLTRN